MFTRLLSQEYCFQLKKELLDAISFLSNEALLNNALSTEAFCDDWRSTFNKFRQQTKICFQPLLESLPQLPVYVVS